jgi:hypothetical protein
MLRLSDAKSTPSFTHTSLSASYKVHTQLHTVLQVYTQNIILAIVAEAYEEAKSNLGTAETSFLMLVIMRIIFTCMFVVYRARMFCIDVLELVTGRQFSSSAARIASRTVRSAVVLRLDGSQQQCACSVL